MSNRDLLTLVIIALLIASPFVIGLSWSKYKFDRQIELCKEAPTACQMKLKVLKGLE